MKISKQGVLNFIGANPKLVTFLIGLGIVVIFTSFGRIFHEALIGSAAAAPTPAGDPACNFPIDKFPKNAISGISCAECLDKNPIFGKIFGD